MSSQTTENYLKAIYSLGRGSNTVTTNMLAEFLSVKPASVTGMLKRLAEQKIIQYIPYEGAKLTRKGTAMALRIVRIHRLVELYLVKELGYNWDEVHAEAEKLEHAVSDALADRIEEKLGFPGMDPHGHPIPGKDGKYKKELLKSLSDLSAGDRITVMEVEDNDPNLLRYLDETGVRPGTEIEILETSDSGSLVKIRIRGQSKHLTKDITDKIKVKSKKKGN